MTWNVHIDRAQVDDLWRMAEVFALSWRNAFEGLIPEAALGLDVAEHAGRFHDMLVAGANMWVARVAGALVGFLVARPSTDEDAQNNVVELHMLYTLPDVRCGLALINSAISELEHAYTSMTLWCLDTNAGARTFYANRGFMPDGATQVVSFGGASLPHTRLRRPLTLIGDEARRRPAIRVILRDDEGCVLLMEHRNPRLRHPSIWLLPGGMPEDDETPAETAKREVWEETALMLDAPGRHVWNRRHIWWEAEQAWEAVESFFLVEVARFEPRPAAFTAAEEEIVAQYRWWTPSELIGTEALIVPGALRHPEALASPRVCWVGR